jgi:Nuclease-related domain
LAAIFPTPIVNRKKVTFHNLHIEHLVRVWIHLNPIRIQKMCTNHAEAIAANYLTNQFSRTFPNARILTNLVIPLPEGSRIPTAEFDVMVVCDAGLYLFEVKGWRDCYVSREKADGRNRWFLRGPDGVERDVADPVAQGCEKLAGLRSMLDSRICVRSFVLLPEIGVELDPVLPAGVITPQDLSYIPRLVRTQNKSSKAHVTLDQEAIGLLAGQLESMAHGQTLEQHIKNCQHFHASKAAKI